ncbi:hypothetical protein PFISCL1PPCAC_17655, partial [Pristionchus fissidentatus]
AMISLLQENSFLRRLAVSRGLVNGILLGGKNTGKWDSFGWVDGTAWNYTNFVSGYPANGFGDCLAMDTTDVAGKWINFGCSANLPFACARPTDYSSMHLFNCSKYHRQNHYQIFTPGFPYDASVPCDFFLKVDAGKRVETEILLVEANECCDHLVLYEGSLGGKVIVNFTGEESGGNTHKSSSNVMKVSWMPNGGYNVRGAMVT